LPKDLYGVLTDTVVGRNKVFSDRQRYLNSGYILGPVREMRLMFERAKQLLDDWENNRTSESDNGSHGSDFIYHGSDQSIFNVIMGQQEYMREVERRRSVSYLRRIWYSLSGGDPLSRSILEGTKVDDRLDPFFTHEAMRIDEGVDYEFGIGLDYASDIGHQTVNSEADAQWLLHDRDIEPQLQTRIQFDCPVRAGQNLPSDLMNDKMASPYNVLADPGYILYDDEALSDRLADWNRISLYTHLCFDQVPVLIHHNGIKEARVYSWDKLWYAPYLSAILGQMNTSLLDGNVSYEQHLAEPEQRWRGGIWNDQGNFMDFETICPMDLR